MSDDRLDLTVDVDAQRAQRELQDLARDVEQLPDQETIDVDVDAGDARAELGELSDAAGDLAGNLGGIPGQLAGLAQGAGPVGVLAGALGAAVTQTVEIATQVGQITTVLGTSTEEASRLRGVFADVGIEADELIDIALQTTGALDGNREMADRLGLSIGDAANPAEALKGAIDGWDFLTATERAELFGEEGVRQIGALIAEGRDLDELLAGIDDSRVLSPDEVEKAQELQRVFADIKGEIEALTLEVGGPLAGALADVNDLIADIPGTGGLADALGRGLSIVTGGFATFVRDEYGAAGEEAGNAFIDGVVRNIAAGAGEMEAAGEAAETAGDDIADAATFAAEQTAILADEQSELQEAYERGIEIAEELADAQRAAVDAQFGLRDAQAEFAKSLAEVNDKLGDTEQGTLDYQLVLDDVTRSAIEVADAAVRVADETATAGGTALTAADRQDIWRDSLLESAAAASGPTRDAILDYIAAVDGIPEEVVSDIRAALDRGDIDEAERLLTETSRERDSVINVQTSGIGAAESALANLVRPRTQTVNIRYRGNTAGVGGTGSVPRSAPTARRSASDDDPSPLLDAGEYLPPLLAAPSERARIVEQITVNLPRAAEARDVLRALNRWRRVNGRQ